MKQTHDLKNGKRAFVNVKTLTGILRAETNDMAFFDVDVLIGLSTDPSKGLFSSIYQGRKVKSSV